MGAVIFTIGPRAALYCAQLLGLSRTTGHRVLATARTAPPLAMMGKWAHSLLRGKIHLGWCSMCSWVRAVREFCLPHLLFFSPRRPHWYVSVPALLLKFIQCGYLWALDSAHPCFECNFFRGIRALFSFSCAHVHVPSISSEAMNPCLLLRAASSLLGDSCVTPKSAAKRMMSAKVAPCVPST